MTAYYNEIDPFASEWLRELIRKGLIANGIVDTRDIRDVRPSDLDGYTQCHFFAGIGGWSYALRLAGWPDERRVWTGSCPCQPFSTAGKGLGTADERHLWPAFRWLIAHAKPDDAALFGEQVASKAGRAWLSGVRADLEAMGHVVGSADLCAASVGTPHIRQRLFWVSVSEHVPAWTGEQGEQEDSTEHRRDRLAKRGATGGIRDTSRQVLEGHAGHSDDGSEPGRVEAESGGYASATSGAGGLRNPKSDGRLTWRPESSGPVCVAASNFWSDYNLIHFRDGKTRRIEPGVKQMVDGFSERMGRLCSSEVEEISKEINNANVSEKDAREALRILWVSYAKKAIQWKTGRCNSLHEAPILLTFLRELKREGWNLIDHLPSACFKNVQEGLRELQKASPPSSCTPLEYEPTGQFNFEPCDAVPIMSQIISRAIERSWAMPFPLVFHGVPARVGRLRGYGNAIVPQVAAEFIKASMECLETIY